MTKSYIFGEGGHARVIASFLEGEIEFVGPTSEARVLDVLAAGDRRAVYLGIGDNRIRRRVFDKLAAVGCVPAICVAPTAFVARDAVLMPGAVICAGAVVGTRAIIGANCIVNTLSGVDHDCVVGDHSQITLGVNLGGDVRLGRDCYVGMKTGIVPGVRIADRVVVRAGSLVLHDLDEAAVYGGIPAQRIRALDAT